MKKEGDGRKREKLIRGQNDREKKERREEWKEGIKA